MSDLAIKVNNDNYIDQSILTTLKESIYPGAKDSSIMMVMSYCKAAGLDPLLKPVHIVPMKVKINGIYTDIDTVMPGIGLYRIQADRTGFYAGIMEPEFGKIIDTTLGGKKIVYPEWCKITVKKIVQGHIMEFTSKEYWIENYATERRDSLAPNTQWTKRPYGQLAKCTEAQALRKAFPGCISNQPTAEELEGKSLIETDNNISKIQSINTKLDNLLSSQTIETDLVVDEQNTSSFLEHLIKLYNVPNELQQKWCDAAGVDDIRQLNDEQITGCIKFIEKKYASNDSETEIEID